MQITLKIIRYQKEDIIQLFIDRTSEPRVEQLI